MPWNDEDDEDLENDIDAGEGDSGAVRLGHWIQERFDGDERFEAVDVLEPGPLDAEPIRVRLLLSPQTYFFVSVLEDDSVIRVGLGTEEEELSKEIEEAATEEAGSLTEFLQNAIESDEELEYEVSHFHDDLYYFSSDIPYTREADLPSRHTRETLLLYLEGYIAAILSLIENAGEEGEGDAE
jgi:hypothetical protein